MNILVSFSGAFTKFNFRFIISKIVIVNSYSKFFSSLFNLI